ncbi:hypothetical protein SAMN05444920_106459 [Nonomuraea solani]|uniref:Uncharacterized protein n=1 Tax=Nonomuraea solani TaxID=1144553 RepID=A0A1H6DXP9_9ACTN|nr:hypothetical protein SAMN05444920_106459 [Nonomuraea solani]
MSDGVHQASGSGPGVRGAGADDALADGVRPRRPRERCDCPQPFGFEDLPEGGGEERSRSWIRSRGPAMRAPMFMARLWACRRVQDLVGCVVTPARCSLWVPCSMKISRYSALGSSVSTTRRSQAMIAWAWAVRNCRQVGPSRRGAGSMPAAYRISHTVEAAIGWPRRANSPWILRCPPVGFSRAIRVISALTGGRVPGSPGRLLFVKVHLRATRLRCQRRIVAGMAGNISATGGGGPAAITPPARAGRRDPAAVGRRADGGAPGSHDGAPTAQRPWTGQRGPVPSAGRTRPSSTVGKR